GAGARTGRMPCATCTHCSAATRDRGKPSGNASTPSNHPFSNSKDAHTWRGSPGPPFAKGGLIPRQALDGATQAVYAVPGEVPVLTAPGVSHAYHLLVLRRPPVWRRDPRRHVRELPRLRLPERGRPAAAVPPQLRPGRTTAPRLG